MQVSAPQVKRPAEFSVDARVRRAYTFADISDYPAKKRFLIRAADLAFYLMIGLIGRTVRFTVNGGLNLEAVMREGHLPIWAAWHDRVFLLTYFWRGRGIVIMTSLSFDGEYIARFIQRFGFGAARGSSSRGGVGALVEMARLLRAGCPAGFLIDGPRGPRHVAKMGPLLLAKKTGHPVLPVTINAAHKTLFSSWDRFQFPWPFTRAEVRVGSPIFIPADADEEMLEEKRQELQRVLNEISS